ncbi:glycoside hydrolase family 2 protein [Porticoccus sp. GXU_MW_L64]
MKQELDNNWQAFRSNPGEFGSPGDIPEEKYLNTFNALVPGTVASSLFGTKEEYLKNIDHYDWWYFTEFDVAANKEDIKSFLRFEGLATYAEIWLNGSLVKSTNNMFTQTILNIDEIKEKNRLFLVFRSVDNFNIKKAPRKRWKTKLVSNQNLRWHRASLLGRIPGWTPNLNPTGPWRPIRLEGSTDGIYISNLTVSPSTTPQKVALINLELISSEAIDLKGLSIVLTLDKQKYRTSPEELAVEKKGHATHIISKIPVDTPAWWPHTHGVPELANYKCGIYWQDQPLFTKEGKLGFKSVDFKHLNKPDSSPVIEINGKEIFCRGCCWTTNDIYTLTGDKTTLKESLKLAKDAGVNMLRVGGTMLYEQDEFYQTCDELGIMVWQDFMFANMDYPSSDNEFLDSVEAEIVCQLTRLRQYACVTVYCGNSEIQQQTAMLGMPSGFWESDLFDKKIPAWCSEYHSDIPYIPSTPTGGSMPFHIGKGISHYFGIGAYRHRLNDRSVDEVRFSSECLGFAHVPSKESVSSFMEGDSRAIYNDKWKAGTPRDGGAGWDFDDIRDFYLQEIYHVNPTELRYTDPERYLALSRCVTGEVMNAVFSRWRSEKSRCTGGLVWFYQDIVPGAGWGVIDSKKNPKAVYYYLKRCWKSQCILIRDNGLDGLVVTVTNELPYDFKATILVGLLNAKTFSRSETSKNLTLSASKTIDLDLDFLLEHFSDSSYNYKFGPQQWHVAYAKLIDTKNSVISEAYYFPDYSSIPEVEIHGISYELKAEDEDFILHLKSNSFFQSIEIDFPGYLPDDNYFHMIPEGEKTIMLRSNRVDKKPLLGYLAALNSSGKIRIKLN